MNADFAKLYVVPDHGQVLILATENDDGYPIIDFVTYVDDLRAAKTMTFADNDTGWKARDKAFEAVSESTAATFAIDMADLLK